MAYRQESIKPYDRQAAKGRQVEQMFDNIAPSYDLLNHLLSLGIDKGWRRKAIDSLRPSAPHKVLDVATGTGDFALLALERLQPASLIGCDISEGMMQIARGKTKDVRVSFQKEDCMNLSFDDDTFDAVTVAYGVRNFADLDRGLKEMHRVLRDGGELLIVELTAPHRSPMKQLFWLYSHIVMPAIGKIVSGDKQAYSYLPATMEVFPQGEQMREILHKAGFGVVNFRRFTFGICTMYLAKKTNKTK